MIERERPCIPPLFYIPFLTSLLLLFRRRRSPPLNPHPPPKEKKTTIKRSYGHPKSPQILEALHRARPHKKVFRQTCKFLLLPLILYFHKNTHFLNRSSLHTSFVSPQIFCIFLLSILLYVFFVCLFVVVGRSGLMLIHGFTKEVSFLLVLFFIKKIEKECR